MVLPRHAVEKGSQLFHVALHIAGRVERFKQVEASVPIIELDRQNRQLEFRAQDIESRLESLRRDHPPLGRHHQNNAFGSLNSLGKLLHRSLRRGTVDRNSSETPDDNLLQPSKGPPYAVDVRIVVVAVETVQNGKSGEHPGGAEKVDPHIEGPDGHQNIICIEK